jgi:tRNA-Thr(GGU) m(6)t(6)A37 methyltransferase TsaA
MNLKVIAYARNGHTDKFGIPRQSREESPIVTRIVFEPEFNVREALRGIEGFSHLWVLWGFDKVQRDNGQCTKGWVPTVRPPRLGGNKRVGVFATRSPFRPNPIGLSSVRLIKVQKDNGQGTKEGRLELIVSGADMLDGTPIYDIKPYLSFSDSHPDAMNGFAEETKDYTLDVKWGDETGNSSLTGGKSAANHPVITRESPGNHAGITRESRGKNAFSDVPEDVRRDIEYILRQDPRPGYQDDPEREYKMDYAGWRTEFKVQSDDVQCTKENKVQRDDEQCTRRKRLATCRETPFLEGVAALPPLPTGCTTLAPGEGPKGRTKGQGTKYKGDDEQCTKGNGVVVVLRIEKIDEEGKS